MEKQSGLIVVGTVTKATGTVGREAAGEMIVRQSLGFVASPWAATRDMTRFR
jgi:hypothetical protein